MLKADDINIDAIAATAGALPIQGSAHGLFYLTRKDDPNRIAIAANGRLILTVKQAKALLRDLPGVLDEYCEG